MAERPSGPFRSFQARAANQGLYPGTAHVERVWVAEMLPRNICPEFSPWSHRDLGRVRLELRDLNSSAS
jgi:hypothetical protein